MFLLRWIFSEYNPNYITQIFVLLCLPPSLPDLYGNSFLPAVQLVLFLFVFESLNFSPTALMEEFAVKVMANPDAMTLKDLLCVLKVYSSLNYDLQHHRQQ